MPLVWAPLIFVSLAHLNNSLPLVNVFLPAQLELSLHPVLVLRVILIAPAAPVPLSPNVQHAPRSSLFSHLDVAYRRAANPNSSTTLHRHARLATRVVQAVLLLDLVTVWHVRVLVKFCKLDRVYLRIAMDPRMSFLDWAFVFPTWCKCQLPIRLLPQHLLRQG